jgi:threonine synthase
MLGQPLSMLIPPVVGFKLHGRLPEGATATAAYDHLLKTGYLTPKDRVVLFNTGGGLKYTDVTAQALGLRASSKN